MLTLFLISIFSVSASLVLKTIFGTLCFINAHCSEDFDRDNFDCNSLIHADIFQYEKPKIFLLEKIAS